MSKAASQSHMNAMHSRVAEVFKRVLDTYHKRMDVVEQFDRDDLEDEVLRELFADAIIPSPAMLAVITKFLKDNEVLFEKDIINEVSETRRSLDERRKERPNLASLSLVPKVVGHDA